jgi:hypothetical protein
VFLWDTNQKKQSKIKQNKKQRPKEYCFAKSSKNFFLFSGDRQGDGSGKKKKFRFWQFTSRYYFVYENKVIIHIYWWDTNQRNKAK